MIAAIDIEDFYTDILGAALWRGSGVGAGPDYLPGSV